MTFLVKANFIDSFKIGDNINYNLKILKVLYEGYNNLKGGNLLIKPILVFNVAIIEAVLYDFIVNRIIHAHKSEKILSKFFEEIKNKKIDKLEHFIVQSKKYDLFDSKDTKFYDALELLRKRRNRIHIENSKWDLPKDEEEIFNQKVKILSEKVLEKLLNTMNKKYSRREEYHDYVKDFELPWDSHN